MSNKIVQKLIAYMSAESERMKDKIVRLSMKHLVGDKDKNSRILRIKYFEEVCLVIQEAIEGINKNTGAGSQDANTLKQLERWWKSYRQFQNNFDGIRDILITLSEIMVDDHACELFCSALIGKATEALRSIDTAEAYDGAVISKTNFQHVGFYHYHLSRIPDSIKNMPVMQGKLKEIFSHLRASLEFPDADIRRLIRRLDWLEKYFNPGEREINCIISLTHFDRIVYSICYDADEEFNAKQPQFVHAILVTRMALRAQAFFAKHPDNKCLGLLKEWHPGNTFTSVKDFQSLELSSYVMVLLVTKSSSLIQDADVDAFFKKLFEDVMDCMPRSPYMAVDAAVSIINKYNMLLNPGKRLDSLRPFLNKIWQKLVPASARPQRGFYNFFSELIWPAPAARAEMTLASDEVIQLLNQINEKLRASTEIDRMSQPAVPAASL